MLRTDTTFNLNWFLEQVDKGYMTLALRTLHRGSFDIKIPKELGLPIFSTHIYDNLVYLYKADDNKNYLVTLCVGAMAYMFDGFQLPDVNQPHTRFNISPGGVVDSVCWFEDNTSYIGKNIDDPIGLGQKQLYRIAKTKVDQCLLNNYFVGFFNLDGKTLPSKSCIINNKEYDLVGLFKFICQKLPELYYASTYGWESYLDKLENYKDFYPEKDATYVDFLEKISEKQKLLSQIVADSKDPEKLMEKKTAKEYEDQLITKLIEEATKWWLARKEIKAKSSKRFPSHETKEILIQDIEDTIEDKIVTLFENIKQPQTFIIISTTYLKENRSYLYLIDDGFDVEMKIHKNGIITIRNSGENEIEIFNIKNNSVTKSPEYQKN